MKRATLILLASAVSAMAYVPNPFDGGPLLTRSDYASIQFLANQNIAAGLTNASGAVWITADSAPMSAINGATAAWNGVSTTAAHFLPVQTTSLSYSPTDGNCVIVFVDDATSESVTSGVLAFTTISYNPGNGKIADSDILFSPDHQFSTTGAAGTYDMQSILTHELGHSMGSNHTNILSATMFYATGMDTHWQTLSQDDIAFVSSVYPPAAGNGYGTIVGATTAGGNPLLGGAITAVDAVTGITVGGFSSIANGQYSFQVPPGNYYVYVEPATNLSLYGSANSQAVPSGSFQSGFYGGNSQPAILSVQAGATAAANLNAAPGLTPLTVPYAAIGEAGKLGDVSGLFVTGPLTISSGQSVDFVFSNPLTGTIAESNIQVIGPATLRTGSLRKDNGTVAGIQVYRFTLDIPPLASNSSATLVFRSGTDIITRSGVLSLTRPQAVNAGSYLGGAVAPGEILSFFGSQLGPASPVSNGGFDASGTLPASLGGIGIQFDQTAAPLFYVSSNQINLQVPYEVSGKASTLMTVSYNGTTVATSTLSVAKSAPGIFVVTNADGSVNGPASPSPVGATLVIYGTGAGLTSGLVETGQAAPANSTVPATVTIGIQNVTPAYAGLTPGSVGLTQVNVSIPAGTPTGLVPLKFSMNGSTTQTVNISVR